MRRYRKDSQITIQAPATGQDAAGQPLDGWTDVCNPWAFVQHLTGVNAIKAGADVSIVEASFRIYRRRGITEGMRIVHDGAVYDIMSIHPDEEGFDMDLRAQRVS